MSRESRIGIDVRHLVSALIALITIGSASASTWYVRPEAAAGTYGKEDGTSYANAFNGLTIGDRSKGGLKWGTGGIKAGDTLYICGNHWLNISKASDSFFHGRIPIPVNGTATAPITIRMDSSSGAGIIWGYGRNTTLSDSWSGPDSNGVYNISRDLGAYIAQDVTKTSAAVYLTSMSTTTWTGNYGAFCIKSGKTYVKTTDGKSPAGRLYTGDIAYRFALFRNSYITFKNCNFPGLIMDVDRDENGELDPNLPRNTHITFDGCAFRYGSQTFFRLYDGDNNWIFRNCLFEYAPDAIGTYGTLGGVGSSYMLVTGCTFQHLGVGIFPHQDAHGLGIRRGVGNTYEHNTFIDTGSAIEFWTSVGAPMRDMTVRYNFIKDIRRKLRTEGGGIVISGDNPVTGTTTIGERTGFVIYSNVIVNCDGAGISSNNEDTVTVVNNVMSNCGIGVRFEVLRSPVKAVFKNNIIYNPRQLFVSVSGIGKPTLSWDYNVYYSKTGNPLDVWKPYGDFNGWRQEMVVDPHSCEADPMMTSTSPATDTDCKPKIGSCAIDSGIYVGIQKDYLGKPIPQGASADIGAFEDANPKNGALGWGGYR
ncbi:right-handed parallel beta-helix repeat-containing protein [bacterium]|nr:right-handed parallel beta-helix repeat-containing protein [bacterium]